MSRGFAGISDNNSVQNVYGLRAAIDTPLPAIGSATGNLVWGRRRQRALHQRGDQYSVKGLDYTKTGTTFELGPDTETTTKAIYGQMCPGTSPTSRRIRREWIESDVSDSIAYGEIVQTGNYATLPGETLKYDATLYNLGAVYHLSENQDVFVNGSQVPPRHPALPA